MTVLCSGGGGGSMRDGLNKHMPTLDPAAIVV